MKRFEFVEASSLAQAAKLAAQPNGAVRAGGIDLMDLQKEHLAEPDRVISIRRVPGAAEIREEGGSLVIGPLVTLAQLASHPVALAKWKAVAVAAGEAASPQVRNQATVIGNLLQRPRCWYFRNELLQCARKGGPDCLSQEGENRYHAIFENKDCAIVHASNVSPAAMLFDGSVKTVKADGSRREIPLAKLFVKPEVDITKEHVLEAGEIVEALVLPSKAGGDHSSFLAAREKSAFDWPLFSLAVRLEMSGNVVKAAHIVFGAAAPTPLRREKAEAALVGKAIDEATARAAAALCFEDATPMTQNGYKVAMGTALTARAILAAV